MKHLESNNILYKLQHGFRAKRSTETQLLTFVHDLYKNLRDNMQTDVIVMDFAKAFDKVPHKNLIHKLKQYGIGGYINQWIESFLHQRQQRVVCEGGDMSRNAHNNKNGKKENILANLANMAKMPILPESPTWQSTKQ